MLNRLLGRKVQEQAAKASNRLPPGQSLTQKFPVLHYGPTVTYSADLSNWNLKVFGLVEEAVEWDWADFNKLPRTTIEMDIHCVTRWSKLDTVWEGVSLKTLIDEGFIRPLPEAQYVIQHADYNYTTNTPLDFLLQDNVLMATHFNGEPLEVEHGYPLRFIVGSFADRSEAVNAYIWKGAKWLRGLEFRATDQLGFWERNGYHNDADPWQEQRFRGR